MRVIWYLLGRWNEALARRAERRGRQRRAKAAAYFLRLDG
ncbi:hypothetical protein SAMN05421774_10882 [Gemmobacter megaterium]|uniref:Uncharacterized protein n=1 Tax=Gemmobacter megaterium TaxID=1086013 RepID=A0A1N7QBC0_9RHOB|nr:hypothetical protein SAMN05421774_10882 [Gemmobacter megaterium]